MNLENSDLIPVEGHSNLFRDRNTGAILNTNRSAYIQYVKLRENREREKNEIEKIKDDIEEIKCLLRELTNGSRQN